MSEVVFTEEQKKVIEKWLKVHGKQMSFDRKHENFWKLFEKSATKELLEEFNRAAGVSRIRIERTKKASTKNIKDEIDRINSYGVEKKSAENGTGSEEDDTEEKERRQTGRMKEERVKRIV